MKKVGKRPRQDALAVSMPQMRPEAEPKEDKRKRLRSRLDCPEALMLYESGASDGQIANKLGVATVTVNHWRKARGLPANYLPGGKIAGAEPPPTKENADLP